MSHVAAPRGGAVLGISADYHDAAAAVLVDGRIVAAAQEERFTRRKHDPDLPTQALAWCLEEAGISPGDLAAVAYHGKPLTSYERVLRSHARSGPRGIRNLSAAVRVWTGRKLWIGYRIDRALDRLGHRAPPISFVEHHLSHAASAFFPSPYERAAVLTFDGVGEWATSSIGLGSGSSLHLRSQITYPDSLGLLYSAVTAFCGFEVNDGEAKLMGLAPYGVPRYESVLRAEVIDLRPDGSFRLDRRLFDLEAGEQMLRRRAAELFDGPPRLPGSPLRQREADLARSIQVVLEDAVLGMARAAWERTRERRACLAGGVALNCVANRRLLDEGPFEEIWVQPAAGDAGGAIGAALWHHHVLTGADRARSVDASSSAAGDGMDGAALGPRFDHDAVAAWLTSIGIPFVRAEEPAIDRRAVGVLVSGGILGWFQGAMEFGPRALGNRSILADPRRGDAFGRINAAIKRREGFRPLAPAVLAERADQLFDLPQSSPYMLLTAQVRGSSPAAVASRNIEQQAPADLLGAVRSPIPACTHVDGSARVQTVERHRSPRFHALLTSFARETGCPALVNTSFNQAGEPIVRTPADAVRCAVAAGLDALVIGDAWIEGKALAGLGSRSSGAGVAR